MSDEGDRNNRQSDPFAGLGITFKSSASPGAVAASILTLEIVRNAQAVLAACQDGEAERAQTLLAEIETKARRAAAALRNDRGQAETLNQMFFRVLDGRAIPHPKGYGGRRTGSHNLATDEEWAAMGQKAVELRSSNPKKWTWPKIAEAIGVVDARTARDCHNEAAIKKSRPANNDRG